MIRTLSFLVFMFVGWSLLYAQAAPIFTPEELVQQQLDGYNVGDVNAFIEPYADDVELYDFPDKLILKGKEVMREQYAELFRQFPNLQCTLKDRMVKGTTVIDYESISGNGQSALLESVVIFKIDKGKISKVYFID